MPRKRPKNSSPLQKLEQLHRILSNHARSLLPLPTLLCLFTLPLNGSTPSIGLPITRNYSIEEIGASRGPQLNFDRLGRLAVISSGSYIVLNDNSWIDLAVHHSSILPILELAVDDQGNAYFGALASWGVAKYTKDGRLRPTSIRPADYPTWINSTNFTEIVLTPTGVLFAGTNGAVHLDSATGNQSFYEISVATAFILDSKVYLSSGSYGTVRLDLQTGETESVNSLIAVYETAELGDGTLVAVTTTNRLVLFDGDKFTYPDFGFSERHTGSISCLESLPDGGFAVAIDGEGLFLFNGNGQCEMALTTTNYRRIFDLAVRDSGILWLSRESSVEKLLYNNPISVVDHRSDVVIGWPQVVQQGSRNLIASNGKLYQMELSDGLWHYRFEEVEELPPTGAWAIATNADHLLIGNSVGVYAQEGETFAPILEDFDANRLFLQEHDVCIVVGSNEIAALRWDGSSWSECAPRISGVGFPSVTHQTEQALWAELGLDRVARIWLESNELHHQVIDQFPWDEPVWVNIGILDQYVVLSGAHNQRVYLDKATALPMPPPPIEKALARAPETILRVSEDENGIVWGTHPNGVLTFHKNGEDYRIDSDSLANIRDQYPVITLLNGRHAWISTESALYHVDQDFMPLEVPPRQPFLVSIVDGKTGEELYSAIKQSQQISELPYAQNHLVFRYFSGGYTPLQNPTYEFSMQKGSQSWKVHSEAPLLTLPSLEEGNYHLQALLIDGSGPIGEPIITTFTIAPPWYRSLAAYILYWSAGLLSCVSLAAAGFRRAKRKHEDLEKLVDQRTEELRDTMQKLTEEARNSATLAERNRLAGEIHDSLQQGLSGLALQLDATLKHDNLGPNLRNRLSVARRMVSFTRQEVQQAVWDLESPLLQDESLAEALRNIAQLLGASSAKLRVETSGDQREIPSRTKHHILRIAQEVITNAIRHSEARQITVSLTFSDTIVTLTVSDDGQGFDTSEVFAEGLGHFGLRGLRARADKIDGSLEIHSELGQGTTISIEVPLLNEAENNHQNHE
ncbi:ATPase, histidine kinase-, DNA gyrase B-, and HSP90-like domain protein [Verrucomicrobiia bacterium DG1235]|nr:ATPase, histidine kinase-, DNA gyrase B-, and HSP90-like domain protein [Verrucomicrobiae bacterium DG1235]